MKRKIILTGLITITLCLTGLTSVSALTDEDIYVKENQGPIEEIEINNQNLLIREKEIQDFMDSYYNPKTRASITDSNVGFLSDYPNYKQSKNYYCGPASIKQAIQYITGASQT